MSAVASTSAETLVAALRDPASYPETTRETVRVHETHISWVFLVGPYAYKVKKPVHTSFLDYSTLQRRRQMCAEEVRLDRRFAEGLYVGVVPITSDDGDIRVDGPGEVVEYAVKMNRFPDGALLREYVENGWVSARDVTCFAHSLAEFHRHADPLPPHPQPPTLGSPDRFSVDAMDNFETLADLPDREAQKTLSVLRQWTEDCFRNQQRHFRRRIANGFIRECHGDLHLGNIVCWHGDWVPFDGIEFNDAFRWIDVMSDAAFVAMDLASRGRVDLANCFVNAYLEDTGDHANLAVLRWYLVFRAMVRAKVAFLRSTQMGITREQEAGAHVDCIQHIELAYQFSLPEAKTLWITHGVSGSGKTTATESIVRKEGAIRLRSDVERKRHFGLHPTYRPTGQQRAEVYSPSATRATYARLRRLARGILRAGHSVVVDATFLQQDQRQLFRSLAHRENAEFRIIDCHEDGEVLRRRIRERAIDKADASDADINVLEKQLANLQPLDPPERNEICLRSGGGV